MLSWQSWPRIAPFCRLPSLGPLQSNHPIQTLWLSSFSSSASSFLTLSHRHPKISLNRNLVASRKFHTSSSSLRWLGADSPEHDASLTSVAEGMKRLYRAKLLPLERRYLFNEFHSPLMQDADFDALPMILLVGQYSTGKTTFIRHLLERDFPGIRVGPEPTTDRFIVIMHSEEDGIIPGNALVMDPTKQFKPLSKFGNTFLNKFQCSTTNSEVLKSLVVVDTPGILSGEKQRVDRGYSFSGVVEWFADRADRVLLLFDAHKLDISDEFKRVIETLHGHDEKIRIVLNKADMVDGQQLMRVYGALMWSLGKILATPEVARVYAGSFWDRPLHIDTNRRLFEAEEADLFKDLRSLPRNATLRKLNDLIKRARLALVHAHIVGALKAEMPLIFGKDDKKARLIANLDTIYKKIEAEKGFSPGDFPNIDQMRESLANYDFSTLSPLDASLVGDVEEMLQVDVAKLLTSLPLEGKKEDAAGMSGRASSAFDAHIKASVGGESSTLAAPFHFGFAEGVDVGRESRQIQLKWIVDEDRKESDEAFDTLGPVDGKVGAVQAKIQFDKSKLPNSVLNKVWRLADVDEDGLLDRDEFCLAMYLIGIKLKDYDLPETLPEHLKPPQRVGAVNE